MSETNGVRKTKSSEAEVAQRVQAVITIRLEGALIWDVRNYAEAQGWGVSDSMLFKYIARADLLIAEAIKEDRETLIRKHIAKRRFLYGRAVTSGEYNTALAILKDEADLIGLYAPKKLEHSGEITVRRYVGIDPDEV